MSHAQVGRVERGVLDALTLDQASRAAAAVGLRLAARLYQHGDPLRDAGQLRLLERFRALLPPATRWRTEVPLPIPGDRRAWDAVAEIRGRRAGCEAETRITDAQALERRLELKLRDGDVDILLLGVLGSRSNRDVLREHRLLLRPLIPLDGRDVLRAFCEGHLPEANGLLIV
jgi:hypothetical protein